MAEIRILIVEDELIIAEDIKNQLQKLDYGVSGIAMSYQQGIDMLISDLPDLVLIDVKIKGSNDGIDLAETIRKTYNLPIIFLTSHSDKRTVARAKKVKPEGYLVKPFKRSDLYTSIEIAISNHIRSTSAENTDSAFEDEAQVVSNCIFVKKDQLLVKVKFNELHWIKAERNYLELHCTEKMILTRSTLKDLLDKLPADTFLQVHKSYAVNIMSIEALEYSQILIKGISVPVGRSFFNGIRERLST